MSEFGRNIVAAVAIRMAQMVTREMRPTNLRVDPGYGEDDRPAMFAAADSDFCADCAESIVSMMETLLGEQANPETMMVVAGTMLTMLSVRFSSSQVTVDGNAVFGETANGPYDAATLLSMASLAIGTSIVVAHETVDTDASPGGTPDSHPDTSDFMDGDEEDADPEEFEENDEDALDDNDYGFEVEDMEETPEFEADINPLNGISVTKKEELAIDEDDSPTAEDMDRLENHLDGDVESNDNKEE